MTETIHFLGGSPLNRVSWLRSSSKFLNMAAESSETRWVVLQAGKPLVRGGVDGGPRPLALLHTPELNDLLGDSPLFGQGEKSGESVPHGNADTSPALEACRVRNPPVVFLGLEEPEGVRALPSSEYRTPEVARDISGTPYFSVDIASASKSAVERLLRNAEGQAVLRFDESRSASATFTMFEAAVFAEARSMLDWNTRNKFCPACGSQTYSVWGGWKLSCTSVLPWVDNNNEGREPCPTASGLHNFAHPRTDAVVITAVLDESGDRILLGRNRKFPNGFFSTLAGFIEPAESFEDAVRREIWEESGIKVHSVKYHSSQPWPYPASLMVGCYALADSSQTIRTDLDNELSEARWFTREEVATALAHPQGTVIKRSEYKQLDDDAAGIKASKPERDTDSSAPAFRVPPRTAIAGVLISDWVSGRYGTGTSAGETIKGNL